MKQSWLVLILVLSACGQAGPPADEASSDPPAASATTSPVDQPAFPAPAALIGEYRVAGIDDKPLDAPVGIAVSIGVDTISYEPRCLGHAWTYAYEAGAIAVRRDDRHGPTRNPDGSVIACLPQVPAEFSEVARAFSTATNVERTPENGIRFSGGGHSVTLFAQ